MYSIIIAIHTRRGCSGRGSGEIIEVVWDCQGDEVKLLDCMRDSRNCDHRMDAGVYCSGF